MGINNTCTSVPERLNRQRRHTQPASRLLGSPLYALYLLHHTPLMFVLANSHSLSVCSEPSQQHCHTLNEARQASIQWPASMFSILCSMLASDLYHSACTHHAFMHDVDVAADSMAWHGIEFNTCMDVQHCIGTSKTLAHRSHSIKEQTTRIVKEPHALPCRLAQPCKLTHGPTHQLCMEPDSKSVLACRMIGTLTCATIVPLETPRH